MARHTFWLVAYEGSVYIDDVGQFANGYEAAKALINHIRANGLRKDGWHATFNTGSLFSVNKGRIMIEAEAIRNRDIGIDNMYVIIRNTPQNKQRRSLWQRDLTK